jgi:hypothetical protein
LLATVPVFIIKHLMKKLFWLTSLVCLCCFASIAQQESDSTTKENVLSAGDDSLFTNFSYITKDGSRIVLRWQSKNAAAGDYFIIERSNDGNLYETIGAIKNVPANNQYEIADNTSASGNNFYRIKYVGKAGQVVYSQRLQVNMPGKVAVKFYPNPVDKLLIIETDHKVELQLINALGEIKLNTQLHPGLQVIDVSTLERGTYILHISDQDHNRNILQQLVKN